MGLRRLRVALGTKQEDVPDLLVVANAVFAGMSNHTNLFPAPTVSMSVFKGQIDALATAQLVARTRVLGAVGAREVKAGLVWTSLTLLRAYVQAQIDADPTNAAVIIAAAGMKAAGKRSRVKALLTIFPRPNGAVRLEANVRALCQDRKPGMSRFFSWQYTTNGGQTWSAPITTPTGQASLSGLPRMTEVGFRVTVTDGDGQADWSPARYAFLT